MPESTSGRTWRKVMGLSKSSDDLEYFPGVVRPERHIVSGWSPPQTKAFVIITTATNFESNDLIELNNVFHHRVDLLYGDDMVLLRSIALPRIELTKQELDHLAKLEEKYSFFMWKLSVI